jgi:putative FmdB family regulatory protein
MSQENISNWYTHLMVEKVQLWGYRCTRCGHEWLPRSDAAPKNCPHCKSPYWDKPRSKPAKQ